MWPWYNTLTFVNLMLILHIMQMRKFSPEYIYLERKVHIQIAKYVRAILRNEALSKHTHTTYFLLSANSGRLYFPFWTLFTWNAKYTFIILHGVVIILLDISHHGWLQIEVIQLKHILLELCKTWSRNQSLSRRGRNH